MKKILFYIFILILTQPLISKASNHTSLTMSASFLPSNPKEGEVVRFSWGARNAQLCTVTGIPGLDTYAVGGSYSFNATVDLTANVVCEGYGNVVQRSVALRLDVPPPPPPPPTITITYPDSVFTNDAWKLKIRTENATACIFRQTFSTGVSTADQPIGTELTQRLAYSAPGMVTQIVICDGPGGSNQQQHEVTILEAPTLPPPQIIDFFINLADPMTGRIQLSWMSTNTDGCTIQSEGVTKTVPRSFRGYEAFVKVGGQTYVLTCFQGNLNVNKVLNIDRPGGIGLFLGANVDRPIDMGENNSSQNSSIKSAMEKLGFPLASDWITYNIADFNGDNYDDVIIHDAKKNKAYVLMSKKGVFSSVTKEVIDVYSLEDIISIQISKKGDVKLLLSHRLEG